MSGAGGIERRLAHLEGSARRSQARPCVECGHGPGETFEDLEVEWSDRPCDAEPEFCGTCGRQLVYVVTWGDIPEGA